MFDPDAAAKSGRRHRYVILRPSSLFELCVDQQLSVYATGTSPLAIITASAARGGFREGSRLAMAPSRLSAVQNPSHLC